jgi:CheY-like chemotaxis protein
MQELAGLRVLLVEDEGTVAMLIEDMLASFGCELVASASRLAQAYAALQQHSIDLAVLDVNIAGEPVFPLARRLLVQNIPLVFSTGYGATGVPPDLTRAPVLTKPFFAAELQRAIAASLRGSKE